MHTGRVHAHTSPLRSYPEACTFLLGPRMQSPLSSSIKQCALVIIKTQLKLCTLRLGLLHRLH